MLWYFISAVGLIAFGAIVYGIGYYKGFEQAERTFGKYLPNLPSKDLHNGR